MGDGKKAAAAVGAGLLTAFLVARAARAAPGPAPGGVAAAISRIDIVDAVTGNPVPRNSPATLVEGSSYTASFTVTNQSTRLGVPVGADLLILIEGMVAAVSLPFPPAWLTSFAADQSLSSNIDFTVPDGTGGQTGVVNVRVFTPDGAILLAQAQEPVTILSAAIDYGASIGPIGVA